VTEGAKFIHAFRDAVLSAQGPSLALARLVALAVAKTLNRSTLESYAGAPYLAELSGLSERTVRSCLALLSREGWLEEHTKASGRNYWLKVRRATIPINARLPAAPAGSQPTDTLHAVQGVNGAGLPARGAGLPAGQRTDSLHVVPPISLRDPELNSCAAAPLPADAGAAAPASEDSEAIRDLYLRLEYQPGDIWEKYGKLRGLTLTQVQGVCNDLDRREPGWQRAVPK
jgi:hypothetical protein